MPLVVRWFASAALLPLFTWQMPWRLGIGPHALHPIEHVATLTMPKLFIADAADRHTTLGESQRLFAAAAEPKEFWVVRGLGHQDADMFAQADYRPRLLAFLARTLRAQSATARSIPAAATATMRSISSGVITYGGMK